MGRYHLHIIDCIRLAPSDLFEWESGKTIAASQTFFAGLYLARPLDREGSIDVYYPLHCIKSKSAQKAALRVLLVLSVLSIIFAILGNVFNDDLMQLADWIDQQIAMESE